jgi:4-diphosphocytidyl-2-C-methyl-D-erythritol kinase
VSADRSPVAEWTWDSLYPAPAKLNLFLHVVGRRADGYHLLQTLFRFIDFGDTLRFLPRSDGEVVLCKEIPGVPPENDLTVRAARALQAATGCRQGVAIDVDKRLPMGGGLGGGSSDAATVLLALNHLWRLGLSRQRLREIGLQLGADVPVFIFGDNAFAEGVGEVLRPVALPEAWYILLVPPVSVPTVDIFRDPALRRDTPAIAWQGWTPGLGHNDLQSVAVRQQPAIGEHLAWLAGYGDARMTGSGACVFAEFATSSEAERVFASRPSGYAGCVTRGLPEHPLRPLALSV